MHLYQCTDCGRIRVWGVGDNQGHRDISSAEAVALRLRGTALSRVPCPDCYEDYRDNKDVYLMRAVWRKE